MTHTSAPVHDSEFGRPWISVADAPTLRAALTERATALVAIAALIVAVVLGITTVERGDRFSPFDEATHFDYVVSLREGEIPRTGQGFDEVTLETWSCRGQVQIDLPSCVLDQGDEFDYTEYPNAGVQYNAFHPPVYYAATAAGASVLTELLGVDLFGASRTLGAVWLWAAMVVMHVALRTWGVRAGYAAAGAFALPLAPLIFHASTSVTNDAPGALVGAATVALVARIAIHRNVGWVLPGVLSLFAASTKTMNALPFVALGLVAGWMAIADLRRTGVKPQLRTLAMCIAMAVPILVVQEGWGLFQAGREVPNYTSPIAGINTSTLDGVPLSRLLPTIVNGVQLQRGYFMDPEVDNDYLLAWSRVINLALVIGPFVLFALSRKRSATRMLAAVAIVGGAFFPLLVQVMAALGGDYFRSEISPRYGMTMIPLAVAAIAVTANYFGAKKFAIGGLLIGYFALITAVTGWIA